MCHRKKAHEALPQTNERMQFNIMPNASWFLTTGRSAAFWAKQLFEGLAAVFLQDFAEEMALDMLFIKAECRSTSQLRRSENFLRSRGGGRFL